MNLIGDYVQMGVALFAPSTVLVATAMAVAAAERSTRRLRYSFLSGGLLLGFVWLWRGIAILLALFPRTPPETQGGLGDWTGLGLTFVVWPGALLTLITAIVCTYFLERSEGRYVCSSCGAPQGPVDTDVSELGVGRSVG